MSPASKKSATPRGPRKASARQLGPKDVDAQFVGWRRPAYALAE